MFRLIKLEKNITNSAIKQGVYEFRNFQGIKKWCETPTPWKFQGVYATLEKLHKNKKN